MIPMTDIEIRDRVMKVWHWYQEAMWKYTHRKINFPHSTDPSKTYQYRWIKTFLERIDEWGFDDALVKQMVSILIMYARSHGLMRMGASILAMQKILDICHDVLKTKRRSLIDFERDLKDSKNFIQQHCGLPPKLQSMTMKIKPGANANIVCWYTARRISPAFMSLSKICHEAMARIDKTQRGEFPTEIELLKKRLSYLSDANYCHVAKTVLAEDMLNL